MKTRCFRCPLCKTEVCSFYDLVRAVITHMKKAHSKLAAASLSDEDIMRDSYEKEV